MRKKIKEEELMEDEKIIPPEENNCFAFKISEARSGCTVLMPTKLTKQDRVNCGTVKCPFYKPKELANSVKHINADEISFETFEDIEKKYGLKLIKVEDYRSYEAYSHASAEEALDTYFEFVEMNKCFKILTIQELREYTKRRGIDVGNLKKSEIIEMLENLSAQANPKEE